MIRVLVADDSDFMRRAITHIIRSDGLMEVIDTAADGDEALKKAIRLRPDVLLLDIDMPVVDGLTVLEQIMNICPMPVVIISGLSEARQRFAIKALEAGAVDFIAKPSGVISYDIESVRAEIIGKVRLAATVDARKARSIIRAGRARLKAGASVRKKVVVIGASTGGLRAVTHVLSGFYRDLPVAIIVVQHLAAEFIPAFIERLTWSTVLDVSAAAEGEALVPGRVVVAPGGGDTIVSMSEGRASLSIAASGHMMPSIDSTMKSVALAFGPHAVGVLLTGQGKDGALGMKAIKDAGGATIAEDETTSIVFGMPKTAIESGCVDAVVPLPLVAKAIIDNL